MKQLINIPPIEPDVDKACAQVLNAICARGYESNPDSWPLVLQEHMERLGVTEDSPEVIRTLARHTTLLEIAYMRLLEEAILEDVPGKQVNRYKSARAVHQMLQESMSALYKVQVDLGYVRPKPRELEAI